MKIILILFFTSIFLFANKIEFLIGINFDSYIQNKKHSKLVFKLIEKNFNHKQDEYSIKFKAYKSYQKLLNDYKKGKIKLILINPKLYLNRQKELNTISSEIWTVPLSNKKFEEYYLIKNINSKASIKNISSYNINFRDGIYSSKQWFKYLILQEHKKKYTNIIKKETNYTKAAKLLYKPFFDKKELSVVSKYDYDIMKDLNPQIEKKLKIIKKSKNIFLTTIGLTHKDINYKDYSKAHFLFSKRNYLRNLVDIKSLTTFSNSYHLEKKDLEELNKFYKKLKLYEDKYEKQ